MWFLFALLTILAWGTADMFYKKGSDPQQKTSHWRILIAVGFVMGVHAFATILITGHSYDVRNIIRYLPVSMMYILSMALGYVGLRYIELSVSSPVCNCSGAVAALLCFIFLDQRMTTLQFIAVAVTCVGIFLLGVLERPDKSEIQAADRKYHIGAIAFIFPILYCVIDGLGTFADAFYLDRVLSETDANLSYEFTFLIVGVLSLLYVMVVRRERLSWRADRVKLLAAVFETAGQFFYVRAMSRNAIVAAPLIASYSIVSVLLGRVFLGEKLSWKQYAVIICIMGAIAVLGAE